MESQRSLASLPLLLLSFAAVCLRRAYSDYSGWDSAHATFYGGADASGTIGEFDESSIHFKQFIFLHLLSCNPSVRY